MINIVAISFRNILPKKCDDFSFSLNILRSMGSNNVEEEMKWFLSPRFYLIIICQNNSQGIKLFMGLRADP